MLNNSTSQSRDSCVCEHNSCLLSAIKSFRNAVVYGGSLRFFHSIAFGILFKRNSFKNFKEFSHYIMNQAFYQALYLGLFSFLYKLFSCFLGRLNKKRSKYHAFLAGALAGFLVFGEKNNVKYHIILYLLARNITGIAEAILKKLKMQKIKLFPFLSAICCGIALFLFENDKSVLTPSLTKGLLYLVKNSDKKMGNWNLGTNDFGVYLERTLVI